MLSISSQIWYWLDRIKGKQNFTIRLNNVQHENGQMKLNMPSTYHLRNAKQRASVFFVPPIPAILQISVILIWAQRALLFGSILYYKNQDRTQRVRDTENGRFPFRYFDGINKDSGLEQ